MFKFKKQLQMISSQFMLAFKAVGAKHVFKNPKSLIKSFFICFIPFLYAFITLWAFFNPLGNINKLPIALVNQDVVGRDKSIVNLKKLNLENSSANNLGAYCFKIKALTTINNQKKDFMVYYFDNQKTYQQHQNQATFLTTIVVTNSFTSDWNNFFKEAIKLIFDQKKLDWVKINQLQKPEIKLQASYKLNPILGEINDFALNSLKDTIFNKFLPAIVSDQIFDYWYNYDKQKLLDLRKIIQNSYDIIAKVIPGMAIHQDQFDNAIAKVNDKKDIKPMRDSEHDYWINHSLLILMLILLVQKNQHMVLV